MFRADKRVPKRNNQKQGKDLGKKKKKEIEARRGKRKAKASHF